MSAATSSFVIYINIRENQNNVLWGTYLSFFDQLLRQHGRADALVRVVRDVAVLAANE